MKLNKTFLLTSTCVSFLAFSNVDCYAQSPGTDKAEQNAKPSRKTGKKESTADKKKAEEAAAAAEASKQTTVDENSLLGRMAMTVKAYFKAKSPKEKLNYVLNPSETEPLMRDYYFREGLLPGNLTQMTTPEAYPVEGVPFWKTKVALEDGRQSLVFIRMLDDNTPKIDWSSEVRYSSVGWEEWIKTGKPEIAEFRVSAQLDSHYPKQFEDRAQYLCIKVVSADSNNTLMAYLNLKDPAQREFAETIASGNAQDCILSLKMEKSEGDIKIASVQKVVSPSWILMAQNAPAAK